MEKTSKEIHIRTNKEYRILIVDDHKLIRDGLKMMFASFLKSLKTKISEAESGKDALIKIYRQSFDVMLIDYHMPGLSGVETIYRALRYQPKLKILALSNYDEVSYVQSMIDAGAKGYILKSIEPSEMQIAITNILSGKKYYTNEIAVKLLEAKEVDTNLALRQKKIITKRQEQILRLIALEFTNEEMADELHLSKRTIDSHRQNLLLKLRAKNTAGLVRAALTLKLA